MAAATAAKRGKRVALLERSKKPGAKILVSGGGRCNFTNLNADASHYLSENPRFVHSALARFGPQDFLALVQKHGLAWHEKKLGQLFCDQSARGILALLLEECQQAGVTLLSDVDIRSVEKDAEGFLLKSATESYHASALILATGGLSFPKLGASDFGFKLARQFGLEIVAPAPALDGFVFNEKDRHAFEGLAGLSADAMVHSGKKKFRENILFTHKGLSGPACLQASLYWEPGAEIEVDLLPDGVDLVAFKAMHPQKEAVNALAEWLPRRLAERWITRLDYQGRVLSALKDKELRALQEGLRHWKFKPASTVGYDHAEVTRGGVSTHELSSKTMESKKVPGLYLIGELVDVTGELGGYNFQWAWSSGVAAGESC